MSLIRIRRRLLILGTVCHKGGPAAGVPLRKAKLSVHDGQP